jgi:hypothetical protein
MIHRPFFHVLLFIASMIVTGSLLLGMSGCTPHQEKPEQPKQTAKAEPATLPPVPAFLPMSVDFDNVALSQVAQFVTSQTGKGFVFAGNESKPITWIESKLSKDKLFESFKAALTASGLNLKAMNQEGTLFSIEVPAEPKVPYQLNYAMSSRGVFFLLGSTVYPLEKFPFEARFDSGHWYALLPKSTADQLSASASTVKATVQ